MVKVLGICGSPRRGGNTEFLLDVALEGAKEASPNEVEVEKYSIVGKQFGPCTSCLRCVELQGECTRKDSFQELRDKWVEADVVIYAIPVYHMTIPGQLRCFIDRLGNSQYCYHNFAVPRRPKVIGAIAQGIHIFSGQEHAITDIINHALLMGCIPATGDQWECYIGAGGWTFNEIEKDALKKHYESGDLDAQVAVRAARSIGRRCTELALLLLAGARERMDIIGSQPVYKPWAERVAKLGEKSGEV